jgi:alkanesulfonate monooxygenase SsuD/methylene tetrahydromethanopterin reductase-like flavin-dependent oxidoreductase (luciferase family)
MALLSSSKGKVEFGLLLNTEYPVDYPVARAVDEQVAFVHQARDDGWGTLSLGHHFLSSGMKQLQSIPFMARLTPESGDMSLMLGILLLSYMNPVETAEMVAALDVMSEGRVTFGVGLGNREVESAAFGLNKSDLVPRLEANLEVIKSLWTGKPTSCDLPWCRLQDAQLTMLPAQKPRPPILMAANSNPAVKRAARMADGWLINPHARLEMIGEQLKLFNTARASAGLPEVRSNEMPVMREVVCAPTREEADDLAVKWLGAKYKTLLDGGQDKTLPGNESFDKPFGELAEQRFVIGTPDDCIEQLMSWHESLGLDRFILRFNLPGMPFNASLASQRLLAREVLPAFRG